MSAAAKHTVLAATSVLILGALAIVVPAGGASSDRDRQAPTTPLNLRVTSATSSVVSVVWDPASDDVAVEGYYVFGDKGKATVDKPEYTVTGLGCGESAPLSVIAFDSSNNRSEKASLTVATAACRDAQPPTAPAGFTQLATTRDAVVLGWAPSVDDTGVVEYAVYRDLQRVNTTSEPRIALSALACGSTYIYLVDAADAAGNRSLRANVYVRTAPCANAGGTPPSTPTGLAASGITQTGLSLSWTASNDDVGVVGYDVYRNGTKVSSPTATSAAQSGLTCGTSYAFGVAARDAAGSVSQRAPLSVSTSACSSTPPPPPPGDTTPPSTPTGLAASGITQTGLSLSWTASNDDVGVVGYDVYRNGTKVSSPTATSAAQSGLTCGTSYAFGVAARDAAGSVSQRAPLSVSTSACSSTPPPPPPGDTTPPSTPTGLAASGITQTGLSLSWTASNDDVGVVGYDVYRNGTKVSSPTATSAAQSGLTCGTSYAFGVAARDAAGSVSQRAPLSVSTSACSSTPPPPPPGDTTSPSTPTGLAVSGATGASVSLRWNASTDNVGVAGYRIYVNGGYTTTAAQLGATVSGFVCGSAYTFEVEATDGAANRSGRASVTGSTTPCPDVDAPSAPLNVAASSRTMTSIALSWFASSDDVGVVGYGLYRAGVQVGTSNSTTGIFSGLACGTNHTLAVDAFDAAGNRSPKSTVMVATTACADTQAPSAPTSLAATNVAQTDLTLAWTASSDNVGVTGYDVLRNGTKVATVTGTSSIQAGLTCGTGYTFAVVARDVAGNSSSPAQLSAATAPCSLTGTAFYVDPAGSDASDGAVNRPWRTLAKACASVPSNAGATIVMRAGTYVESSTCNLPPKTNLQGAGGRNGATTIKGSADPLISLVNASGAANVQTVSGIKLDGQNRTAGTRGMKVENVRGLTIRDMLGEGFKGADAGGALDLNKVWNADVGDSIFRNSAGIFPTFAAGSLGIRNATDSVFHDLIASDDKAMGIKGGWLGATLTNVEFYNLRVTCGLPTVSTGGGTTWPAISFEMNNMDVRNVTIRNSYFNATLSLTAPDSVGQLPSGQWRYQVYNNHFDIPSQAETGQLQYALELHNHSSDVHHNFFDGGVHPISEFGSMPHRGNRVHHNVFANGENYSGLMRIKPGLFDFEFYKNTFVWQQSWINMLFRADELTPSSNPNIHDNIFASTASLGDTLGPGLASATITRNVFYNITARGTNALTSNPQLPLSGGFPNAYIPNPGSPAQTYGAFADGAWSGVGPQ